ncbi:F-box domain [Macleaya cordata]|uniref:F-box domain n=1 Tax=Macleaya cordata TaxID=56857 RepID=A0A200R1Y4_MACCD|nr:F-box domain [Macleaya cordata]
METLPPDVTSEILSRLPVESIFECKRVSKTWRALFRHVKAEIKEMGILFSIGLDGGETGSNGRLYYGELRQTDHGMNIDHWRCCYKTPTRIDHPTVNNKRNGTDPMVGSCNGLVCFTAPHSGIQDPVYICNPFTKEYTYLQRITCQGGFIVSGFGYHHSTNEYKVVRIYYSGDQHSMGQVQVYTLGHESEWRNKGEITYSFRESPAILANGALHWLDDKEWNIVAFDLADEEFRLLPSPPCFRLGGKLTSSYQLQVLGGYLSVVHQEPGDRVDIWSFKMNSNYDLNEHEHHSWSWSREFSIAWEGGLEKDSYEPFALTKSNEVLLWYNTTILSCYDPKTATLEKIVNVGTGFKYFQAIPHIKSFVSLEALGELTKIRRYRVRRFSEGD